MWFDSTNGAGKLMVKAKEVDATVRTAEIPLAGTGTLKGYVNHGATAGTTRPIGFTSVEWVGSVEPTNAINGDSWINTA
jgi:hypothetical protein